MRFARHMPIIWVSWSSPWISAFIMSNNSAMHSSRIMFICRAITAMGPSPALTVPAPKSSTAHISG
ncbi:hypothetical protein BST45_16370 [Mycobacterium shinjukuense]|nr:hypothetical protein BST45_16370 [Mycobacterium shinjukuense]